MIADHRAKFHSDRLLYTGEKFLTGQTHENIK